MGKEAVKRHKSLVGRAMSRRDFLRLSGAGLLGVGLLGTPGCGGGGERADSVTNLVFSSGPDDTGTLTQVVNRFNEEYEGEIQAEYRKMPSDTGSYFDEIRIEFQSGASPIDVISGDVIWPAQLAANGWILDLSDLFTEDLRSDFIDAAVQSVTYQDKIWGVPWFADAGVLYYRRDLLEQSGFYEPPRTYDELKNMARTVQGDSGTRYGFVFQGANYEGGVVNALEYIWNSGGEVLDPNDSSRVTIDSPEAIRGLQIERSMIEDGIAPIAVVNYTEPDTQAAFLNGSAVFCRNWPYMYGLLQDPGQSQITPDQVEITTLPRNEGGQSYSGLGGWNMYINAASKGKLDAIWEFIQFMSAPEQQKFRALKGSFIPTRQTLLDDQEIVDTVPVISLGREAIQSTKPRPVSPYYSDMSLRMAEQFSASLQGEVSPEEAVSTLQEELTRIVEQEQA
jgi:multiple sugar transport system substrate-binding protein